jgi:hypothetical protein
VDQAGRPFPEEYSDDVEAHGVEVRLLLRQVPFGQGAYGCLLAGGDRFERVSVSRTPSQLDLDEDEGVGSEVQIGFRALLTSEDIGDAERLELAKI